jgi:sugar O-acyltransferase (sialic acid O-acetyltransferase NeuD family)
MTREKVVIFGLGRGADTAYRYFSKDSPHEICAFTVDSAHLSRPSFHGLPVVGYEEVVSRYPPDIYRMFVALGFQRMNRLRAEKYLHAKSLGYQFVSYLSSHHYSLEGVSIGENCFILDSQTFNLDVSIGNNVTMWSANQIGDRTVIGDHAWVSSHVTLAGDVTVGPYCFLGTNTAVSNRVKLGTATFVGSNTHVSQDTVENSVFVAPSPRRVDITSEKFLAMLPIN